MSLKNFRVEDITFKNARKQSEILKELGEDEIVDVGEVKAPLSLTPEQVIGFYEDKVKATSDLQEKRVYSMTIKWIKDLQEAKLKINKYRAKELQAIASAETPNDIQEEENK